MTFDHIVTGPQRFRGRLTVFALCTCLSAVVIPSDGFAVKHMDRNYYKNLELIEFVLEHDSVWWPVLNQKVKIDPELMPGYANDEDLDAETRKELLLMDNDENGQQPTVITPLPVIRKVLQKFSWLGTYVDFAVHVLQSAFMCTAFEFLKVQVLLTRAMYAKIVQTEAEKSAAKQPENGQAEQTEAGESEAKQPEDGQAELTEAKKPKNRQSKATIYERDPINPMIEAWKSLTVLMDKVGAVGGNLELLTDMVYEYTGFILDKPGTELDLLEIVENEIGAIVESKCVSSSAQEVFKNLGVIINPDYLFGEGSKLHEVARYFQDTYFEIVNTIQLLHVETMDMQNWKQILDFQIPSLQHINLFLKIDELLKKSPKGKEILKKREQKKIEIIESMSDDVENPTYSLV